MHIIALEYEPTSLRGGQQLSFLDVCRSLSERGHSISLLYLRDGNLLEEYQRFCAEIVKVNGYLLDRRKLATSVLNLLTDIRKISAHRDSIVYSNQLVDTFFGYTLAFAKNVPLVCHLRQPASRLPVSRSGISQRTKSQPFQFQKFIGRKGVNRFITISNQTKREWIASGVGEKKIEVVYNGINPGKFKPPTNLAKLREEWHIHENTQIISYAGRLDTEKGIETLIKAFALLVRKNDISVRLLIAGKPLIHSNPEAGERYKESLNQLITHLGIEQQVSFLGHLTNVMPLYQVSDVTVLPSLWSEPFGRTIIESMACETPVVASRVGGIPEILTGEFASGLFEPGNEEDLCETLSQKMDWRDADPQLGRRCRTHVQQNFNIDKTIAGIENVLLKVVKR
jgi:glycosyltransferase involved in cell wall biosynthesis